MEVVGCGCETGSYLSLSIVKMFIYIVAVQLHRHYAIDLASGNLPVGFPTTFKLFTPE